VPAAFFATQLEAAKLLQADLFRQWKQSGQGKFAAAADLKTVLRPKIDTVSRALLAQWARTQALLARSEARQILANRSAEILVSVQDQVRLRALSSLLE